MIKDSQAHIRSDSKWVSCFTCASVIWKLDQMWLGASIYDVYWSALLWALSISPSSWIVESCLDIAARGKSSHIPYAEIEKWQSMFIKSKYLPWHIKIKQLHNSMKLVIQGIFEHLLTRQKMYGQLKAFQFKCVKVSNTIVPIQYPNDHRSADTDIDADADNNIPLPADKGATCNQPNTMVPSWQGTDCSLPLPPWSNKIGFANTQFPIAQDSNMTGNPSDLAHVIVDELVMNQLCTSGVATVAQKTVPMFGNFAKIILCNNIQLICWHNINIYNTPTCWLQNEPLVMSFWWELVEL